MENKDLKIMEKTKQMINELKTICSNYGLGNSSSEYKIITEVFLYKFLNDKFLYEIKNTDEKLSKLDKNRDVEEALKYLSEEEYECKLIQIKPNTAKFKRNHLISYLYNARNLHDGNIEGIKEREFYELFDNTLIDLANYNMDIFSVRAGGQERIKLFSKLSVNILEANKKNDFCRIIIDKLVQFSFEEVFEEKYDFFATIFEYLIKDYNKDFGKYAEYYTPNSIARIIARIIVQDNPINVTIYDPAAGTGTLVLAIAHEIGEQNCTIYTQDISQKSNEFLRLNLILNNLVHSLDNVIHGNTLTEPAHYNDEGTRLEEFDYIVSNPPFKIDFSEDRDALEDDKFKKRFFAGVPNIPPKKKESMPIYLMFMQHILYSLNKNGKAAIVVPTGFLTAQSKIEKTIREYIIKEEMLKGVISMPSNIFATTGTNVSIIFIDKANKGKKVLLVDASKMGKKVKEGSNQKTVLEKEEIEEIVSSFNKCKEKEEFSKLVTYDEIKEKNYSFSAGQYFDIKIKHEEITKEEFEKKIKEYKQKLDVYFSENAEIENEIKKCLGELKYEG